MNAYDFDQTIFYPDSSYCFVKYCLKKYPKAVIPAIPGSIKELIIYLRRHDAKNLKQKMFSFLPRLAMLTPSYATFGMNTAATLSRGISRRKGRTTLLFPLRPNFCSVRYAPSLA